MEDIDEAVGQALRYPADGSMTAVKTPTVPEDPARGIINGLALLKTRGVQPSEIHHFVHGMTIGLNTLLQRKGADIALFVFKIKY
ncbi:hypothetical protein DT075_38345 [Bacillus licheniformis]|nr:hypothetical protein DT075_38345 [Bacillus licheniformis]